MVPALTLLLRRRLLLLLLIAGLCQRPDRVEHVFGTLLIELEGVEVAAIGDGCRRDARGRGQPDEGDVLGRRCEAGVLRVPEARPRSPDRR